QPVKLENPLNDELAVMRTSLVPGMVHMLEHNQNRDQFNVKLFEAGHVFATDGTKVKQTKQLSLGATETALAELAGSRMPLGLFRIFKGDVETLLEVFEHESLRFEANDLLWQYHPGRSARVLLDGKPVACFGQLGPEPMSRHKLKENVYLAEFDLEALYKNPLRKPRYEEASRFPAVERDFSFLFADGVQWSAIEAAIGGLKIAELQSVTPAEIFRPDPQKQSAVPAGSYSILIRAVFQSSERTLRDEETQKW